MNHSALITKLKLAYSPVSNWDFTIIRSEEIVQEILTGSMLYIIGQRPILTFENVNQSEDKTELQFEIAQQGVSGRLRCTLPLLQENIGREEGKDVIVEMGSLNPNWQQTSLPANKIDGFKFYDHNENFLLWLSPDKFLHNHFHKEITATVEGDFRPFTTAKVHYVGKATDQDIWKRLTGHEKLQDILSLESPFNYGTLPTHEIVLLLFRVADKLAINVLGNDADELDVDHFVDLLMGNHYPTDQHVSLDAEKALIKLLSPAYNKQLFAGYPKSKDGLYQFGYDRFAYQILENLTLVYKDGQIDCSIEESQSDIITVENNETLQVIKQNPA